MKSRIVSICVPVYNGEKYIEEAIRSISCQTYSNIEIIVSDNNSTDNTVSKVKSLMKEDKRIRLNINEENIGFSGNLNKLISLSNSDYIAIYHADDIYEPTIVEEQLDYLVSNAELAGCFTLGKMIDENSRFIKNGFLFKEENLKGNKQVDLLEYVTNLLIYGGSMFICPTSMIKKKVYNDVGKYDTKLKYIEDQDMYIRILEKYKIGIIAKELVRYRVHNKQVSRYYRDLNTEDLSLHITHLTNYLDNNEVLKKQLIDKIDKFVSNGYLRLIKNNIIIGNRNNVDKFTKLSKRHFTYNNFYYIIQNSDIFPNYILVKTLLLIKRNIRLFLSMIHKNN